MTKWLNTDEGYVNQAHLISARRSGTEDSNQCAEYKLTLTNGETVTKTLRLGFFEDYSTVHVVPNTAGAVALRVRVVDALSDDPIVLVEEEHIVAWRVTTGDAQPVLVGGFGDEDEYLLIRCPDGKLRRHHGTVFDTLDDAKRAILEEEREELRRVEKRRGYKEAAD